MQEAFYAQDSLRRGRCGDDPSGGTKDTEVANLAAGRDGRVARPKGFNSVNSFRHRTAALLPDFVGVAETVCVTQAHVRRDLGRVDVPGTRPR